MRRGVFLAVSGVVAVFAIILAHEVLLPFVLALVVAYVLTPAVGLVERRLRAPRALAILAVYAVVLGAMALFGRAVAPRIGTELRNLRDELPQLAHEVKDTWAPALTSRLRSLGLMPPSTPQVEETSALPPPPRSAVVARPQSDGSFAIDVGSGFEVVETRRGYEVSAAREKKDDPFEPTRFVAEAVGKSFVYAQENTLELARIGRDIVLGVSRGIFYFFLTLMLAAYLMMTREKILAFVTSLVRPSARPSFEQLIERVDRGLSGVVRGQLIICLINGVLSAIGFAIVGLKYWPVLALVAMVLSLIPIFGSIISSIPAVAIGLTQGIGTAAFVLLWVIGIHQVEANLLNPKIMGDAAKIHPVLVIFSLLAGEHFFHVTGALLAVPCMSIAQSLFLHMRAITETRASDAS